MLREVTLKNSKEDLALIEAHDALDTYFECITACTWVGGEDIECVTRCLEIHLDKEDNENRNQILNK